MALSATISISEPFYKKQQDFASLLPKSITIGNRRSVDSFKNFFWKLAANPHQHIRKKVFLFFQKKRQFKQGAPGAEPEA
jgi:hypothetical protein